MHKSAFVRLFLGAALLVAGYQSVSAKSESTAQATVGPLTVTLNAGWNGVAFQSQSVTSLTSTGIAGMAFFDGTTYQTRNFDQASVNNAADGGARRGFWVFGTAPGAQFTYSATDDGQGNRVSLKPGYNLVSFCTNVPVAGSSLVARQNGNIVPLGSVVLPQFTEIGTNNAYTQVDVTAGGSVQPGRAYWIFSTANVELSWATTGLSFQVQPGNLLTQVNATPPIKVQLIGSNGQVDTNFNGQVTLALGNNPGQATLLGSTTQPAAQGVATFSDIRVTKPGIGYTLTASAQGQTAATSSSFRVGLTPLFQQFSSNAVTGSTNSQIIAVGDFNKDGNPDVAVQNDATVAVRLGNGTGGLGAESLFATFNGQTGLVTGDFDKDGNLDLVSAGNGKISFLKGNNLGTFPTHVEFDAFACRGINAADLDADQDLDVVITDSGTACVMLNNANGTFTRQTYTGGTLEQARGVQIADLNGDGKLDLAIACFSSTAGVGGAVWFGTGTPGNFFPTANQNNAIASPVSDPTLMCGVGDFDADGDIDVCTATVNGNNSKFRAWRNSGTGNFTQSQQLDVSPDCFGGAMLDVNQDGLADYVAGSTFGFNNNGTGETDVFISKGDGTFVPALPNNAFKITANQTIRCLNTGDFNKDGKPDFVTCPDAINIQLNNSQ